MKNMKNMKTCLLACVSIATVIALSACGSSSSYLYDGAPAAKAAYSTNDFTAATEEAMYDEGYSYENSGETASLEGEIFNDSARKLIKTYNLDIETEDFDGIIPAIDGHIASLGGYVQDLNTYNGSKFGAYTSLRYSYMTVRIPVVNLEKFVNFIGEAGNITSKNLSVEDVTLQYVDTASRRDTYEIEQERLLALLEKCETVEDMITIESRLSEVRYKLESQESQLRTYDNLVDYATVYLCINEVEAYTAPEPVGYWEQVGRSFNDGIDTVWNGLKNFFIWFAGALPVLVIWAVIIVVAVIIIKAISVRSKRRKELKKEKRAEELMNQSINTAKEKAKEYEQ